MSAKKKKIAGSFISKIIIVTLFFSGVKVHFLSVVIYILRNINNFPHNCAVKGLKGS